MYRLDDIFNVAHDMLDGKPSPNLPPSQSTSFDAAWHNFLNSKLFYAKIWDAFEAFVDSKPDSPILPEPFSAASIKFASAQVSMAYITCGLNCARLKRAIAPDLILRAFSQEIGTKLYFMATLAKEIKQQINDKPMPDAMRTTLAEFYSLSIFTMSELRPNIDASFHKGIDIAIEDYKYIMAKLRLPRLISVQEFFAQDAERQGVTLLPRRPGLAIAQAGGAEIVDFDKLKRRQTGRHEL